MEINGRLEATPAGRDLLVTRRLGIGLAELWRWVTESGRTARWYGPWTGDARPGGLVDVTMAAEEGSPTSTFRIDECRPPAGGSTARLQLASTGEPPFNWVTALELEGDEASSAVTLRHVGIPDDIPLADLGAGWEFYLDALVAAVEGRQGLTFAECLQRFGPGYAALS